MVLIGFKTKRNMKFFVEQVTKTDIWELLVKFDWNKADSIFYWSLATDTHLVDGEDIT